MRQLKNRLARSLGYEALLNLPNFCTQMPSGNLSVGISRWQGLSVELGPNSVIHMIEVEDECGGLPPAAGDEWGRIHGAFPQTSRDDPSHLRFLGVSATSTQKDSSHMGCKGFIKKPVDLNVLLSIVEKFCQFHSRAA